MGYNRTTVMSPGLSSTGPDNSRRCDGQTGFSMKTSVSSPLQSLTAHFAGSSRTLWNPNRSKTGTLPVCLTVYSDNALSPSVLARLPRYSTSARNTGATAGSVDGKPAQVQAVGLHFVLDRPDDLAANFGNQTNHRRTCNRRGFFWSIHAPKIIEGLPSNRFRRDVVICGCRANQDHRIVCRALATRGITRQPSNPPPAASR